MSVARTYTVTVVSTDSGNKYAIDGVQQDSLHLIRGQKYIFNLNVSGHPFYIQTSGTSYNSANVYNSGVTNNGASTDSLIFIVPYDAPNTLYYVCQYHSGMGASIEIVNLSGDDLKGDTGDTGVAGPQGDKGDTGSVGPTGTFDTSTSNMTFETIKTNSLEVIASTDTSSNTTASLKGSEILGVYHAQTNYGISTSANNDGTIIAIGGSRGDSGFGVVHIYEWNGSTWSLKGNEIMSDVSYN